MTIMKKEFYVHRFLETGDITHRATRGYHQGQSGGRRGKGKAKAQAFYCGFHRKK